VHEHDQTVVIDQIPAVIPFDGIEVQANREVGFDLLVEQVGPRGDFGTAVEEQFGALADRVGPRGLAIQRRKASNRADAEISCSACA